MKRLLLFIAGALLLIDGLWLISMDKIHLGIVLPLLIGSIFIVTALFYNAIHQYLARHATFKKIWKLCWAGFWVWLISLAGFFAYLQYSIAQSNHIPPVKAILVLGSGIEHGQPSATLKARLDAASDVALNNPEAVLIMTGGLGFHEKVSEAEVMKTYIVQNYHVNPEHIYLEDRSTSTELNIINSKAILKDLNIRLNQPIAIATSDFHLPRASAIAQYQGYTNIYTISAPTPLYIRYNSWLREYFAFLSGWLLHEY